MTETQRPDVTYFLLRRPGEPSGEPLGVLQVVRRPDEVVELQMSERGVWEPTDFFQHPPAPESVVAVEVPSGEAGAVLFGWRDAGRIPLVEGLIFPPLPRGAVAVPPAGSGPVTPAQAQAIADQWVGDANHRGLVFEFDIGYVVFPPAEMYRAPNGMPTRPGRGYGVIDKATGERSVWPPQGPGGPAQVAQRYRERPPVQPKVTGPPIIAAAIAAAEAGDLLGLHALFDWRLCVAIGAGDYFGSEHAAKDLASALSEADEAMVPTFNSRHYVARPVALFLAEATGFRGTTSRERAAFLAELQWRLAPHVQLPPRQMGRVQEIQAAAERVADVFVVRTAHGDLPVAVTPQGTLMASGAVSSSCRFDSHRLGDHP